MGLRNAYRFNLRPGTWYPVRRRCGLERQGRGQHGHARREYRMALLRGRRIRSGYESKPVCQALYNQGPAAVEAPLVAWDHTTV